MFNENSPSLGIIRETRSHWERRTPIVPDHVRKLVELGIQVYVQPSKLRIFSDEAYEEAGAILTEDLSVCGTILGVKQVSVSSLLPQRTFCMFSHTIKAQPENMPLLDAVLERKVRLIDYEAIVEVSQDASEGKLPGKRLVAFGRFAGLAGTITFLRGLGERLLALRYNTAFLHMGSAYMYPDLETAKDAVKRVGRMIEERGLPKELCPFIFAVTGNGRVSQGVQEILTLLPCMKVNVDELSTLSSSSVTEDMRRRIYYCVVTTEHMVTPIDSNVVFSKSDYYRNPSNYRPIFHEKVAPYVSVIIHGSYWDMSFCRLLTDSQLQSIVILQSQQRKKRLIGICDITCDYEGAIESLKKFTSIERPFYVYDTMNKDCLDDLSSLPEWGILFHATDNLPAELAKESSEHFSNSLLPFLPKLASHMPTNITELRYEDLPLELQRACIATNGKLTPHFSYISRLREIHEAKPNESQRFHRQVLLKGHLFDSRAINEALDIIEEEHCSFEILRWSIGQTRNMPSTLLLRLDANSEEHAEWVMKKLENVSGKNSNILEEASQSTLQVRDVYETRNSTNSKVLVLGSGRVAAPLIDYLADKEGYELTIASNEPQAAVKIARNRANIRTMLLTMEDMNVVKELIENHDVVVSLLPSQFHANVARLCVEIRKHFVTASYVSPEIQKLDQVARERNVMLVNEVGLDPGIDHMLAHKLIARVRSLNGEIVSFHSWCGGLPAPHCAHSNPFRYKFSWSPKGVLIASQADAKFREDGKLIQVAGKYLMTSARPVRSDVFPDVSLPLEVLPNRDSTQYIEEYQIPEAETVLRGTLRYAGFCEVMDGCMAVGLLETTKNDFLLQCVMENADRQHLREEARSLIASHWKHGRKLFEDQSVERQISSFQEDKAMEALEWLGLFDGELCQLLKVTESPVDALATILEKYLTLGGDEQDAVLMLVQVQYRLRNSHTLHTWTATLSEVGDMHWNSEAYKYTAMARTVGITCAMAVKLVTEKKISASGVIRPSPQLLSEPILSWLTKEGISIRYSET
ncbi:hypothetical protein GpartN1_g6762.t1 [Galdieria partita]|uniref:Alanine dehydrogenase/pyridine nucleotide transhydrogenase N-terminal domain-containing protein n=1 Tax=Galdieria partita TaxID=83374 RepID=A0A9C7Q401_9RHOD|nr:hypothetical protein GpartN1_g6762.t1 [Galdieria partita]